MSLVWPRLPGGVADSAYVSLLDKLRLPEDSHDAQVYAPVGGTRASVADICSLRLYVEQTASAHGFPKPASDADRIAFDRAVAFGLHERMPMSWSEAAARDVWSFIAIVALPHLTDWRFGTRNPERWVGSDLTRHTWARLWWHAVVFRDEPDLLPHLTEGDLNQLLERRSIGGNPRLACKIAREVIQRVAPGSARRLAMREVTARLRRHLAFTETYLLSDQDLTKWVSGLVEAGVDASKA